MSLMNHRTKYGILLLLPLIAGLSIYGLFYSKTSKADTLQPPDLSISAAALANSFDYEEGHADSLYLYKTISVSGIVSRIHKVRPGMWVATLAGQAPGRAAIDCTLDSLYDPDRESLKPGDAVAIRGRCAGRSLNVQLVQCIIEK